MNFREQKPSDRREVAVFYTCGTCNLKCRYCGIDKNPILLKIDKDLEESFNGDYYYNRVKEYFPKMDQLRRIETWGGEPFLHMERIHYTLHKLIPEYPHLSEMFSSTNFSYPEGNDKFFDLMEQFRRYAPRHFDYHLQLSMDGPTYINDVNRGKGVTERCTENFYKMLSLMPERLPDNVSVHMGFKPTLDNTSIRQLYNSKQKIIEYYQHFEPYIEAVHNLNMPNVDIEPTIPNTAVPSPVTVEEGKMFAELCKNCREIEQENLTEHYFKFYNCITPYAFNMEEPEFNQYKCGSRCCGTGSMLVGFLPFNLVSTCHEGFTCLYEDYKKYAQESSRLADGGTINYDKFVEEQGPMYCVTDEGYKAHEEYMSLYANPESTARLGNMTVLIMSLAMAGQIDQKYINEPEANKAALFLQTHTSYCIKDNYNTTGSFTLIPVGIPKLLLNGAIDYIILNEGKCFEGGVYCCDGCK